MNDSGRRYRTAGWVYGALGVGVVLIVSLDPQLAVAERRSDVVRLFVALGFVLLFAAWIAQGYRIVGAGVHRWFVRILAAAQLVRASVFTANAIGYRPRLRGGFALEAVDPRPKFWLAALLMLAIAGALAWASSRATPSGSGVERR